MPNVPVDNSGDVVRSVKEEASATQIVGAVRKGRNAEVRVTLQEFKGAEVLDVRVYFRGENGQMKPTGKGITVSVRSLPQLAALINEAAQRAEGETA
jgi:Transcriptional Coactivator p15 (PC4)